MRARAALAMSSNLALQASPGLAELMEGLARDARVALIGAAVGEFAPARRGAAISLRTSLSREPSSDPMLREGEQAPAHALLEWRRDEIHAATVGRAVDRRLESCARAATPRCTRDRRDSSFTLEPLARSAARDKMVSALSAHTAIPLFSPERLGQGARSGGTLLEEPAFEPEGFALGDRWTL